MDNDALNVNANSPSANRGMVVELTGLTKAARVVLNDRPLVILYFPFRMGRLSRSDPKSTAKQDLLLPDYRPFFVSRNHIVFDRENENIILIDETSTCGTFIDEVRIGSKTGVEGRKTLAPGLHTLAIGGPDSPFLFQAEVRPHKTSDFLELDHDIPDKLPQARMLYQKLCEYEHRLIADTELTAVKRAHAAHEMAKVIVGRSDLLDMLRCLASNPVAGEDYMARHAVNVTIYSIVLYLNLKFPAEEIITIAAATLLHDIGMEGIDPGIVLKKGPLSADEFDFIKKHTVIGKERLTGADDVSSLAAAMALGHHERMDSSGYPRGTNVLPDTIRHLGFLDSFEALTHDRPHRPALAPHEAVCRLTARENSSFDMATRKVFLNAFSFFPVSTIVKLSTGEIGQVVVINQNRPLAPQVRILQSQNAKTGAEGRLVDLSKEHLISIVKEIPDRDLLKKYVLS